jgi:type IV pilus assembly protein PilQ
MKKLLFGTSALLATSVFVAVASPTLAKSTAPAKSIASAAASQVFKFSNGGTAVFNSKKIAQATQVNPLVPSPTLNTNPPRPSGIPVPPLLPRASAPPVGDMAVSELGTAPTAIDLGTAERIPRLVLRDAPVREVLSLLARAAGLNIAFAEQPGGAAAAAGGAPGASTSGGPTVSLDIENESVQDVFNYVLRIACVPTAGGAGGAGGGTGGCTSLEANRVGRTIFVGPRLPDDARNTSSRTVRLNQVSAAAASAFLATQGAEVQRPVETVTVQEIGGVQDGGGGGGTGSQTTSGVSSTTSGLKRTVETRETIIKALKPEEGSAALLLRGLGVSTDERLNSLTLVGSPQKIAIATSYLTQLDARKRQASVSVKVIDVNLLGLDKIGTSFSFDINDTSVVNNGGVAVINLGRAAPSVIGGGLDSFGRAPTSVTGGSFPGSILDSPFNVGARWLGQLQLAIQSSNAKVLSDPTLTIQEGQRAQVKLVEEVFSNLKQETTGGGGNSQATTTITTEKAEAGLQLDVEVDRIDDNGFVSMRINPRISAPLRNQVITFGSGATASTNTITLLQKREVSTGLVRVRDGQTLLLTGVIQESDKSEVRKVPILGDIPLLGTLFRSTSRSKERKEVIVMVTPNIMNDTDKATYGYGYTPSADVQRLLQQPR